MALNQLSSFKADSSISRDVNLVYFSYQRLPFAIQIDQCLPQTGFLTNLCDLCGALLQRFRNTLSHCNLIFYVFSKGLLIANGTVLLTNPMITLCCIGPFTTKILSSLPYLTDN